MLSKGETFTVVEDLTGDALLHEIAEMIGGKDKRAGAPRQAREMLGGMGCLRGKLRSLQQLGKVRCGSRPAACS